MTTITLVHAAIAIGIVSFARWVGRSNGRSVGRLLTYSHSSIVVDVFLRFIFVCLHDGITDAFNPHMHIASK